MDRNVPSQPDITDRNELSVRLTVQNENEIVDVGVLLTELRPYLMAIANAQLPRSLAGKLGASDAAQWTITQAYQQFADFRGSTPLEFAGWVRQILVNHLKSVQRRYSSEKRNCDRERSATENLVDDRQPTPSAVALSREEWNRLNTALAKLPVEYQSAIHLRNVENLSFRDMGQRLNRSEDAARKLWARAIRLLQQEMGLNGRGHHDFSSERS